MLYLQSASVIGGIFTQRLGVFRGLAELAPSIPSQIELFHRVQWPFDLAPQIDLFRRARRSIDLAN